MNYDDPRVTAKAKRDAKIRERQSAEVALSIMATTAGRRWVYDKLTSMKAFHTPYTGETNSTMFNCGQQNVGFAFLAEILGCAPAEYIMMLQENSNDNTSSGSSDPASSDSGDDEADADDRNSES